MTTPRKAAQPAAPAPTASLADALAALLQSGQNPVEVMESQMAQAKRQQMLKEGGVVTIGINKNVKLLTGSILGYFVSQEGVSLTGGKLLDDVFVKYPTLAQSLDVSIISVGQDFMESLAEAHEEYGQDVAVSVEIHVKQARIYKSNPADGSAAVPRLEIAGTVIGFGGTLRRPQEDIDPLDMDDLVEAGSARQIAGLQTWREQRNAATQAAMNEATTTGSEDAAATAVVESLV